MSTFLYFAYGSNMLTNRLIARCSSAHFVGTAYARGYTLKFSKKSKDTSGKATLTCCPDANQYGVIFEIDKDEKCKLDKAEGVGHGYDRTKDFKVICPEGNTKISVTTYLANKNYMDNSLQPFDWYLALVVAGANQHNLPAEQISALQQTPFCCDDKINRKGRSDALEALCKADISSLPDFLATFNVP